MMTLAVMKKDADYWVKVSGTDWGEFMELLRDGGDRKEVRVVLRFESGEMAPLETLRNEILVKILEYNELYARYVRELNASQINILGGQILGLKKDLKELEVRLAFLEQREPRKLPLRPLPVRYLGID